MVVLALIAFGLASCAFLGSLWSCILMRRDRRRYIRELKRMDDAYRAELEKSLDTPRRYYR